MKIYPDFHKSTGTLHMGCMRPRSYFIPYSSEEGARKGVREESPRFLDLCGEWDFRYYPSASQVCDVVARDFTTDGFEKINVPSNWQMYRDRGYDELQYTNFNYPYPLDPPHVPDAIPAGLYVKSFNVTREQLANEYIYLNLEGVDSCFYLWINNDFALYSSVSHGTTEKRINDYLFPGENTLKILVFKWGAGSYLEDQDMWRMSGIFRPLYLLFRPKECVTDAYVQQKVSEDLKSARVDVTLTTRGEPEVSYVFRDPAGNELARDKAQDNKFSIDVKEPELWSDESPVLYELMLENQGEYIRFAVGFNRIEIKDGIVLANGKPIKVRGVNHHDTHPEFGHTMPYEQIEEDLRIIKANNMNMVRTSHYPADPRFYDICDRLGLWVVDEADIETHGFDAMDGNRSYLSDDPEWQGAYLDRAERLFERDKNHPSIMMWSLGNESGYGCNQRAMSDYIRSRDSGKLVHYEGANALQNEGRQEDWVDLESMMYPPVADCEKYLADPQYSQPLFLCEFCHAMGNGPGDLADYDAAFDANDRFLGGCIWEFCDHGILLPEKSGARKAYAYGGDFGEKPHDGNFCIDGLMYPDRTPGTGMLEAKQVFAPVKVKKNDDGSVTLFNRRFFTDTSDLSFTLTAEVNGYEVYKKSIDTVIPARGEYTFTPEIPEGERVYLNVICTRACDSEYAKAGDTVALDQLEYRAEPLSYPAREIKALNCALAPDAITVTAGELVYSFSNESGYLTSVKKAGNELLANPMELVIWRAPVDNDRVIKHPWYANGYPFAATKCYDITVTSASMDEVTILTHISLGAPLFAPLVRAAIEYTVSSDGSLKVSVDAKQREKLPFLPRLGLRMILPETYRSAAWFGYGPGEAYCDKRLACRMGRLEATREENFEPYIRPQENGAHFGTLEASLTDGENTLAVRSEKGVSFGFSAYTAEELTDTTHDHLLPAPEKTVVYLDGFMSGMGSHSCGPELAEKWRTPAELAFDLTLIFE